MWREIFWRFLNDDSGPTAAEYAMMVAMVAITAIVAIRSFGDTNSGFWGRNVEQIHSATGYTP
jgi:Flp pilus assembly pilin Flp